MTRLYLLAATANVLVLTFILLAALSVQFAFGELPCPLCFLQRIALMLCAIGPLYILAQNRRSALAHRDLAIAGGMSVLAALLGASISTRQVFLHILPGDLGYGGTVLGMHLYTICFLVFVCHALAAGAMLLGSAAAESFTQRRWPVANGIFWVFCLVAIINLIAVIVQAGWSWMLPPNPVSYLLLSR
ncbi:disulfide bond formation protein B [Oxalobacteraceae bacterium CAVE-383]|nr:disulfide bond formation protein B [Oxalobacteraceae bacterium CAVE-383]